MDRQTERQRDNRVLFTAVGKAKKTMFLFIYFFVYPLKKVASSYYAMYQIKENK